MANEEPNDAPNDAPAEGDPAAPRPNLLTRLREWSSTSGHRKLIVSIGLSAAALVTVALWLVTADIAAGPEDATIEQALAALDIGDEEAARSLVGRLQQQSPDGDTYGGQLYLLGALKIRHAERQWSPERARTEYYVASRYLNEARSVGFPEGRETLGLYLLGRALIESRQFDAGIEATIAAIAAGDRGAARSHLLLARAHRESPRARHDEAIREIQRALEDPQITAEQRTEALLMIADSAAKAGLLDDADRYAAEAAKDSPDAESWLMTGQALATRLAAAVRDNKADVDTATLAQQATVALERARRLDKLATGVSRRSEYLLGLVSELKGDEALALRQYAELRRKHGSSSPGVAAALAEGDLLRRQGDPSALEAYRRVLDTLDEPSRYRGTVLSLEEVRQRLREAHLNYLTANQFADAQTLADRLAPPLTRSEQLALRAETLRRWGDWLEERAIQEGRRGAPLRSESRLRYREAAVAYEQLAESRYAEREFIDDLWDASEAYLQGQSFADAARVLERYLRSEPQLRNASALLKLGQAHLALGESAAALNAFNECLEFHPDDAASYNARIDAANAHLNRNDPEAAERLLNENLMGTAMTPASPEWRDSKFALGRLYARQNRYLEAIDCLSEAVDRYPDDPQSRTALYLIAESHRHAAAEPLARLAAANTVNERERARADANDHLERALNLYAEVQNEITLTSAEDDLDRATLRNCYMMRASVLFEMGRYDEAIEAYSNVTTLYQNEPFSLVTLVQISHCRRRLQDNVRARGAIEQARMLLARLPPEAEFANSTNLTRTEWDRLLSELMLF
ncbi:tetratricopeptide repeat protein [Botrimarina hoheduenensis]|uniref:Tetratricopeptide repeat protein n=1 Tax=Botrimarina hoheduenensis TaxID=2528000 RepID=A0A5C5VYY5_9BACT|nr:tetratricopeptide repeat protein [Botrimarina hoheduenensis]TWT43173.1 Tetratricopeptide repeat protein [Botrimarina hoheduenensis]